MEGYPRCNHCGKEGHFGKDYPSLARAVTRPPVHRNRGNRPQATGHVYAMIGVEAASSGNLIMDCCVIVGMKCCMLYDSGVTHSFVLDAYVK